MNISAYNTMMNIQASVLKHNIDASKGLTNKVVEMIDEGVENTKQMVVSQSIKAQRMRLPFEGNIVNRSV